MQTTNEYFNLTDSELLEENDHSYTREERLLFDEGLKVVFFDDLVELKEDQAKFATWYKNHDYEVKTVLQTINERIAVILV